MTSNGTNGKHATEGRQQDKVRVAIIGVGNCASAFVQGVHYYKDANPDEDVPGLMHVDLGGYHVRDIEFTAAFDIDSDKVGKDLGEAIWSGQNNTMKFAEVPVEAGREGPPRHDPRRPGQVPQAADHQGARRDRRHRLDPQGHADRRRRLLPAGRVRAGDEVVRRADPRGRLRLRELHPVFIARENYWSERFRKAGLPVVGDDIKSQVGATIVHRTLARLFHDRGVKMLRTSQLNVGGNMDFYNMLERERLESKKISKTNAVTSIMGHELPADDVYIGRRTTCRG
jgi:myo-inositol-1-phosphate synthase